VATDLTGGKLASRLDKLYEFERAPVTADRLHSGRYFAGLFAGEHVAATEFVIGALFVQWGAGARDLLLGLLIGNALAVLSWAFICAPIAVRTRLTLYWYVRRIIGPGLTVVYNFINAILYCCLAAAMIGVSASAVILALSKLGLDIRHPGPKDVMPNSVGWVAVVLLVGAVVVSLAIMGFKRLSQFAALCSPWMFIIFIAGAIAALPQMKTGNIDSLANFWTVLDTEVWTGQPSAGNEKLSFWHIMFFAWFCNLAMHVGLSDMAVFRYAKSWTYGFYSAFGMYLGHYVAWICAGIMGAIAGGMLNPGEMADLAAGPAGVLAVLLAGWTTANPTIYRAGLALQIITPNWPRWTVTLVAGAITTVVGCSPAIFMRLLDFVAIYGLMLMPIGAVIVAEHWFFPLLGLRQYWTDKRKMMVNLPALISWLLVLGLCFPFESFFRFDSPMQTLGVHLFFRWLPGWFIAAGAYTLICLFGAGPLGARATPDDVIEAKASPPGQVSPAQAAAAGPPPSAGPVAWIAGAVALLALAACLLLPIMVFMSGTDEATLAKNLDAYKTRMIYATILYFVGAIIYMSRRERVRSAGT
jgi:purine-cytosine permease-like protein